MRCRQRTGRQPVTSTYYRIADDPLGPYHRFDDDPLVGDPSGSHFSGKVLHDRAGRWQFLAFRLFTLDGTFIGDLSDPMPVTIGSDGGLRVELP